MHGTGSTRATAPLEAIAPWRILVTHGSRFTRFGMVGLLGAGVNTALLYLLSQAVGLNQLLAAALAAEVAILFNFALNDRWTFRDAPPARSWIRRAVRYNALALAGLAISLAVFAVLTGDLRLYYLGANLLAIGAATIWNYALNARFTWYTQVPVVRQLSGMTRSMPASPARPAEGRRGMLTTKWKKCSVLVLVAVLLSLFLPHTSAAAPRGSAFLPAPSLPELNAAIARAEPFVSQLYKPIPGQMATVAEYYDVPLRVYLTHYHKWILLGEDKSAYCPIGGTCMPTTAISHVVNRRSSETFVAEFRSPQYVNSPRIRVDVNWDYDSAHYQITLANDQFDDRSTTARVYLSDLYVGTFSGHDVGHSLALTFAKTDISHLHSFRYTIRHGNQELQNYYWYKHDRKKYERLAIFLVQQGYKLDYDVHASIWGYGSSYPDDLPDRSESYHDCHAGHWSDNLNYLYESKVCQAGVGIYVVVSRGDSLTMSIQAMQILNKYGDPQRSYSDGGNRRYTPTSAAADLEPKLDRSRVGIPMCTMLACNYALASGIRTFDFGALETMLGYGYGRQESRGYADTVARLALRAQIGNDDTIRTCDGGRFYRPVQKGGFFVSWDASMRYCQSKPFGYEYLDDALNMPDEYQGVLVSNTETTDDAYAFLVLYRCKKYGFGCATGAPKPSVTGLTAVVGRPVGRP